jgi:6-phosphogluconolactonase
MNMKIRWNRFDNRDALITALGELIENRLSEALGRRGQASLALSGGGTPMPLYAALARSPLDWTRVLAIPTDERWVPADHAASNQGQIRQQMTSCPIELLGLVPEDPEPEPDADHARSILASLPDVFDVVIVGMGGDGHFASLFPHSPALAEGLDPDSRESALVVTPDPLPSEAPFARISLTLSRLLDTRELILLITGEDKRQVLEAAASADADPEVLPIAALIRAAGERLNVFWSP